MRLTRKKYEASKAACELLQTHQQVVRQWQQAIAQLGPTGDQVVDAIILDQNEVVKVECLPSKRKTDANSTSTKPEASKKR